MITERPQRDLQPPTPPAGALVELFWLPLGAGAHVVRVTGRIYEAVHARLEHRHRSDLYHSALQVRVPSGCFVIEMAPAGAAGHGAVGGGSVGSAAAGRFGLYRYEIRCWRSGTIDDVVAAVASPVHLSRDEQVARRILELVPLAPTPVWGRDELHAGEMWNSNSLTSWLLATAGIDLSEVRPPAHGRAPGWTAGLVVAARGPLSGRAPDADPLDVG